MLRRLLAPLAPLDLNAAAASPEARTPRPYGKAAARASARGRHACGIAGVADILRNRGHSTEGSIIYWKIVPVLISVMILT